MKNKSWKYSRVTAAMMAAAVTVTTVFPPIGAQAAVPNDNYENKTKNVLWSTSFEDGESALDNFKASTPETGAAGRETVNVMSGLSVSDLPGDITSEVDLNTIKAVGADVWSEKETVDKLFDKDAATKLYTRMDNDNQHAPSAQDPIIVTFNLKDKKEEVVNVYSLTSANDQPSRDPKAWILEGSKDGKAWVALDQQSDQAFSSRAQQKIYKIQNTEAYAYYRFQITQNNGASAETQLADLQLGTGKAATGEEFMAAELAKGPGAAWNQKTNQGWTGSKSLEVSGAQTGDEAYASNILFDSLNTKVTKDTYLSYVIFPALAGANYDYEYTSMHMAIDLKFKDGSYLSDLEALDQNENGLNAAAQGASRVLTTNQWNRIYSNIGKVAEGKTIEQVLVVFDKNAKEEADNLHFKTYFDDIELYTKQDTTRTHLSDYVYILRGTNDTPGFSRGLTAPAVTVPHGFNFWVPCTNVRDNKTYDYQDTQLQYMTISHEPSYWVGDRGTWQFMVNTSLNGDSGSYSTGQRAASFSHDNEVAKAHYYSVEFDNEEGNNAQGAKMEMTSTDHCGVVRATFTDDAANRNFVFDCVHAGGSFAFEAGNKSFNATSDHTSNGSKRMYVYGEFSETPTKAVASGKQAVAQFAGDSVELKIATSYISAEQAKRNLQLEVGNKSFDAVLAESQATWDKTLGVVSDVTGATEEEMISLYSNLYRLFMYPNNMSENVVSADDATAWKYKSPYKDANAEPVSGHKLYINNGFWDTYRTTWSAYALLTPNKAPELLNGLVQHFNDQTWVPRWIAPGGTNSMVGTSSDVVFGDAMIKGIPFDDVNAYKSALRNAATVSSNLTGGGRKNLNTSIFAGYTAGTDENFSWTMEGYINDFGIAQMAKTLAERETDAAKKADYLSEYQYYLNRAQNYVLLFDDAGEDISQKWLRGKESNGSWTTENTTNNVYDPVRWRGDYTETNGYNMSVSVPQDGQGLANLYGGRDQLAAKIDSILSDNSPYSGYGAEGGQGGIHEQLEAREVKLGQYGHNNQPSHHILYMYNYAGQPWKTQKYVRDVLDRCYTGSTFGQGYLGDEDNGEMSGWYVFSALGFYPVTVGSDEYAIGSPLFDSATINMDNGKQIKIKANNNSKKNVYVQSVTLNGSNYTKNYFKHADLKDGAEIVFEMGSAPNENWGSQESDLPTSINKGTDVPNPKKDTTSSAMTVDEAKDVEIAPVEVKTLYGDTTEVANLIDNDSETAAPLNEKTTTLVFAAGAVKDVDIITLTSSKVAGSAPTGLKVYGANENEGWTELASYNNISFEWTQYTRPFAIDSGDGYAFYKIELTGGSSLAEIELLASEDIAAELKALIVKTKKVLGEYEDLDVAKRDLIIDKAAEAQVVLDKPDATKRELEAIYKELLKLVSEVEGIRSAYNRIEAEEFSDKHSAVVNDGHNIGGVKKGTWTMYKDVKFDAPIGSFEIYYSAQSSDAGGYVEVYVDEKENAEKKLLTIEVPKTGAWSDYRLVSTKDVNYSAVTPGYHDVYLVFKNNTSDAYVSNVDWFRFGKMTYTDVMEKIEALPEAENVTLKDAAAIAEARRLYEALGNRDKAEVTNRKKLEAAERALAQLEAEKEAVEDVISKIDAIGNVTLESEEAIKAAREAYDALNDVQKELVKDYLKVLTDAETALAQQKTDKDAADAVADLIANMSDQEESVTAAREAYDKLTSAQKVLVGVENLVKLTEAEVQIAQKKSDEEAIAKVVDIIAKLDLENLTVDSAAEVQAAREVYNMLSDAQKAGVTNLQRLADAETKMEDLKAAAAEAEDKKAANAVTTMINNIGSVTLNSETAIESARNAYSQLSEAQKKLVENVKTLEDAEAALIIVKKDKESADAVASLIANLDNASEEKVREAREAYNKLTDAQKAMVGVDNLSKLTEAESKFVQGGEEFVTQVTDMIAKLTNISLDSAKDIEKARIAYDLLTDAQKKQVTNYTVLEEAERKLAELRGVQQVRLPSPTISSVKSCIAKKSLGRVKITFQKPAKGQTIYAYRRVGSAWRFIGKTTGSYIYDKKPVSGKKMHYFLRVRPAEADKDKYLTSNRSKSVSITIPSDPKTVKASVTDKKQVKVTWSGVSKAKNYYIYRSTKKNSGYRRIATVKSSKKSYIDKKVKAGKTYYYKVVVKAASKYSAGKAAKAVKVRK